MEELMVQKILSFQDVGYTHQITKELSLIGNEGGEMGFRICGSSGELRTSRRIEAEMKKIGMTGVKIDTYPLCSWELLSAHLDIEADGRKLCVPMSTFAGMMGTPAEGLEAEIVYVGKGRKCDYWGKDVKGKIVFFTFDFGTDWPIPAPIYQAQLMGAAGCLFVYTGSAFGTKPEAINCFNGKGKYEIPAGNISRNTGQLLQALLEKGKVRGRMTLEVKQEKNALGRNVVGYIEGDDPEKYIILGAHMDGFFHAYQDDLLGVGINLTIAKAIIASGYKPQHTIIVIAHGAEEHGGVKSHYDWCHGSWHAVNELHPEWSRKTTVFLNIDAIRPGTPKFIINSTSEYHGFFKQFTEAMQVPEHCWPGGLQLCGLNGTWSDDYNYAIKGIPGVICGRGPAEWSYQNYHTQYDDYSIFEAEADIIKYVTEHYTKMLLAFDKLRLPPFAFQNILKGLDESLQEVEELCLLEETKKLQDAAKETSVLAAALEKTIEAVNQSGEPLEMRRGIRAQLFEIYEILERDFMKLNLDSMVIYGHQAIKENCMHIAKAIEHLKRRDKEKALACFEKVDLNKFAVNFSEPVYDQILYDQKAERVDLYWATGKIHPAVHCYGLVEALRLAHAEQEYEEAVIEMEAILEKEKELLADSLKRQTDLLSEIMIKLKAVLAKF